MSDELRLELRGLGDIASGLVIITIIVLVFYFEVYWSMPAQALELFYIVSADLVFPLGLVGGYLLMRGFRLVNRAGKRVRWGRGGGITIMAGSIIIILAAVASTFSPGFAYYSALSGYLLIGVGYLALAAGVYSLGGVYGKTLLKAGAIASLVPLVNLVGLMISVAGALRAKDVAIRMADLQANRPAALPSVIPAHMEEQTLPPLSREVVPPPPQAPSESSIPPPLNQAQAEDLQRLQDLLKEGVITQDEFRELWTKVRRYVA